MKSLQEINAILDIFENNYRLPVKGADQLSERWFQMKLGVISASNAYRAVSKSTSETRFTYLAELVAQVCTGASEEINSKHMDWGRQHEAASRAYYEFSTSHVIVELPFIYKNDTFRIGCSPDGYVTNQRGLEIKCPYNTGNFVKFLLEDDIKSEWDWQANFAMWVLDATEWDFSMYDRRMKKQPMKTITIQRDDKKIKVLEDAIPQLIHDMDDALKKIGIPFGEQWKRLSELPPAPSL